MGGIKSWLLGGSDELGWDDLLRRVVNAVAEVGHYGARGQLTFPPDVEVQVVVGKGSVEVIRGFVEKPELERQVRAALANRLDCEMSILPLLSYQVTAGDKTAVHAGASARERTWSLAIQGGDRDGTVLELAAAGELRFGRGPWHGGDQQLRNDLVICEQSEFVSRRAGRFVHAGALLEVESLDQGDYLLVVRASGETVRPARTATGRVALRDEDVLELRGDGEQMLIRLAMARRTR